MTRLTTAKALGNRVADAYALITTGMRTRRCPENCGLMVRYRAVSDAEAKRLDAMAADHAGRHQSRI